ncbi:MAG: nucleotide sugar dehydrogenase [Firmicutes bacterium]|nr:nucleotide sugar dehydrogenase [Bacillota bacterium]
METVCVVGLGYIGLPTAIVFALNGKHVVGVDTNPEVVELLHQGKIHIEEPGLQDACAKVLQEGRLVVSERPVPADAFVITVPTPLNHETNEADLSYVERATESLLPVLKKGDLVVLESTVPPGTVEEVMIPILQKSGLDPYEDLWVVHSPERVIPGNILYELEHNSRIVGGMNRESALKGKELYSSFVKGDILITDAKTAELTKLVENTFRDVNIALANELAIICSELGVNVWEVRRLANYHPRVNLLSPGPGVGGHCIPIDPWFVIGASPIFTRLIRTARTVNEEMPKRVCQFVETLMSKPGEGNIAVLGVAYKADVDDVRESPALRIIDILVKQGYTVKAYDPHVKGTYKGKVNTLEDALTDMDLAIVTTDHAEFRCLTPEYVKRLARNPVVMDTRNMLDSRDFGNAGVLVYTLGNGKQLGKSQLSYAEAASASDGAWQV